MSPRARFLYSAAYVIATAAAFLVFPIARVYWIGYGIEVPFEPREFEMNLSEILRLAHEGEGTPDRPAELLNPDVDEELLVEAYGRYAEPRDFAPGDRLRVIPSLSAYLTIAANQTLIFVRSLDPPEVAADGEVIDSVIGFRGENCCGAMHLAKVSGRRFERKSE